MVINLNADLRKILLNQKQSLAKEDTLQNSDDKIGNLELKQIQISEIKNEISLQTMVAKWLEL